MKASPWEKEDAMHEDIPILNWLVPKEFTHEAGSLTGVTFEKVGAVFDEKGRAARLLPTGEPDVHYPCDDVVVAVGQENFAFPWIERDIGLDFRRVGYAGGRRGHLRHRPTQRCSSAVTPRSGPRTSYLGGRPRP